MPEKEAPKVEAPPDAGIPEHKVKNPMHDKPQIAPDGHENLSQEDIDARD